MLSMIRFAIYFNQANVTRQSESSTTNNEWKKNPVNSEFITLYVVHVYSIQKSQFLRSNWLKCIRFEWLKKYNNKRLITILAVTMWTKIHRWKLKLTVLNTVFALKYAILSANEFDLPFDRVFIYVCMCLWA